MNNLKQVAFTLLASCSYFGDSLAEVDAYYRERCGEPEPPNPADQLKFTYTSDGEDRVHVDADREIEFYNEKLGVPYSPPSLPGEAERRQDLAAEEARETELRELAKSYWARCDMFDAMIAPGGKPRTEEERRSMRIHAWATATEIVNRVTVDERASLRYYIAERGRADGK